MDYMIEKLKNNSLIDESGDCWGERLPDNHQIVAKINEIIEYLNMGYLNKKE